MNSVYLHEIKNPFISVRVGYRVTKPFAHLKHGHYLRFSPPARPCELYVLLRGFLKHLSSIYNSTSRVSSGTNNDIQTDVLKIDTLLLN